MSASDPVVTPVVTMGRILGAFGVRGWVKIAPFSAEPDRLLDHAEWMVSERGTWRPRKVRECEAHGSTVVALLEGVDDRDQAALLKGCEVGVPRSTLPPAGEDEFYWADLVGLDVVNVAEETLGKVAEVFFNGGQDVLRISDGTVERLIPFVPAYIDLVDLEAKRIVVDWQADW